MLNYVTHIATEFSQCSLEIFDNVLHFRCMAFTAALAVYLAIM